jgi:hypothetical protein
VPAESPIPFPFRPGVPVRVGSGGSSAIRLLPCPDSVHVLTDGAPKRWFRVRAPGGLPEPQVRRLTGYICAFVESTRDASVTRVRARLSGRRGRSDHGHYWYFPVALVPLTVFVRVLPIARDRPSVRSRDRRLRVGGTAIRRVAELACLTTRRIAPRPERAPRERRPTCRPHLSRPQAHEIPVSESTNVRTL